MQNTEVAASQNLVSLKYLQIQVTKEIQINGFYCLELAQLAPPRDSFKFADFVSNVGAEIRLVRLSEENRV